MNDWLLAVPVLLPIIGSVPVLLRYFGKEGEHNDLRLHTYVGGLVLINSLFMALVVTGHMGSSLVLFRLYGNLTVSFKVDRMGALFAGMIAFLWPLSTLYAFEYMRNEKRRKSFFAYYVMTYGITAGIALAGNLVTLYLFYEMLTLVTFPLVLFPMTKEAKNAARKYLYYSIGGAAFAFIGLVFVLNYSATGTTEFVAGGMLNLEQANQHRNLLFLIYVLAFFGFGVKAAIFPLHGWLPRATVAPTPVTALLHAVAVVKSGAFAILRFTYFNYGADFLRGSWAQWVVMAAAMVTIAFGSTMAVREVHWKKRLAYSTVANLSYILFGVTMMTPLGMAAALSHLVIHAMMKICAFFCAGVVQHQADKHYIYEVDGMGRQMPLTFGCFLVSGLSLMGIPLFGGFISKWNLIRSAFEAGGVLPCAGAAVILYSALMTGIYMLTVAIRAFFPRTDRVGEEDEASAGASGAAALAGASEEAVSAAQGTAVYRDPGWQMMVPLLIFAACILLLGIHPAPLMEYLTAIGGEAA